MVSGRDRALVETAPIITLIEAALRVAPDDERREALLVIRASLKAHGLGLAHIHVRLNSSQVHNAARRLVGLETDPNDPANRRSYFFQGGDGYLLFLNPAAATASIRQILGFAFDVSDETGNDPIYATPDYAAEFFATVEQEFTDLVDDPDYAALLNLFDANLLYRSGSRPVVRQAEEWGRRRKSSIRRS